MSLSDLDQKITVIRYLMKKKINRVKKMEQKMDLSENQKIFIGEEYELFRCIDSLINATKNQFNAHLGKLPPAAVDLEESVLGAIILEKHALKQVRTFLKPEHFYQEAHQTIYSACLQLADQPVDMRTVVIQLRKNGVIDLIGGAHYIAELTAKVSSAANLEYHARVLIEFAIKRQLIVTCANVLVDAYDDTADCFELLDIAEKQIAEAVSWKTK